MEGILKLSKLQIDFSFELYSIALEIYENQQKKQHRIHLQKAQLYSFG